MAKSIEDPDKMTKPRTVQLSMNIDPDLKTRAKILAISKNITLTELVTKYIEEGLTKDEKQSK